MINAVGKPNTILVLGGSSDIAKEIVKQYGELGPLNIILAARSNSSRLADTKNELETKGNKVTTVDFDAQNIDSHQKIIDTLFKNQEIDVAIVAFGVLPDNEQAWKDHKTAIETVTTNYTAAVSVGVLLADNFIKQGHGQIIAISSVAGEFVRPANFVYGSTKAGLDGFYLGLREKVAPNGVKVLVVRPGQVRTSMTAHMEKEAPLTTTPQVVAKTVLAGTKSNKALVWAPNPVRYLMSILRHIPRKVINKLPL